MKRHAMVLHEPPADGCRLQTSYHQIVIPEFQRRIRLQFIQQMLNSFRRFIRILKGFADFAGPVPFQDCIFGIGEKLYIFKLRFARRAGRPAENPGGFHAHPENALKIRVFVVGCLIH